MAEQSERHSNPLQPTSVANSTKASGNANIDDSSSSTKAPASIQRYDPEQTRAEKSATMSDKPPDGGYGWVIVLGVFLINFHSWGINSSYGVFLAYYLSHNTYPGATTLDFAFVGGLSIGCAMLIAPISTNCVRRFGTRITLSIGIVLEGVALITAGSTYEIWQLFLSQGVCFGLGMGFLFVASVGLAPQWFDKHRGLANGICAAGSGIGALTYNLATNAIIERISIGWAFRILGICCVAANTFSALIVKDRNAQGWGFFSMLGYVVLLFSLPNYAKQDLGLTASQGSIIAALLNLGQGIGRPPVGYFSDTIGRINMAVSMTFLSGIFVFAIWLPSNSYGVLILYAILGGTILGTYWATVAPVTAEVMGLPHLASGLSITWLVLAIPTTFSEPVALEIAQKTEAAYLGTQIWAGVMYVAAAACLMPVRAWKIRENQRIVQEKTKAGGDNDGPNPQRRVGFMQAMFAWRKV